MTVKSAAFIFAAGLGTRLRPLTDSRPKALVRYKGTALIDLAVTKMTDAGIRDIVVNVHHFPDMIADHLRHHDYGAHVSISDERAYLRDTAGGLKYADPLLGDAELLVLYNVDIVSNVDVRAMMACHRQSGADVTLAVRDRPTSRYLVFSRDGMRLCGWRNVLTGETTGPLGPGPCVDRAFSGLHVMNRRVVQSIPTVEKLSLTQFYVAQSRRLDIKGYCHDRDTWMDVGKYDRFRHVLS